MMADKRIRQEIKLILILAVLTVILFALTFGIKAVQERKTDPDQILIEEATMTELPDHIEITDSTGHFVIADEKGTWYLTDNRDVPINGLRVTDTRVILKYFAPGRVLTGQKDNLEKFGLTDPGARLKLISGSKEMTYLVGNYNQVTDEYYVVLEGSDTVFLIPGKDGEGLKKTIYDYVDAPDIVDAVFDNISEISVSSPEIKYDITIEGGKYMLRTPDGTSEIERAEVMEIFNSFTSSVAYRCVDYDCSAEKAVLYGLADPEITVSFKTSDGSAGYVMRAGTGSDGTHYIAGDPGKIVYSVSNEDYEALEQSIIIG